MSDMSKIVSQRHLAKELKNILIMVQTWLQDIGSPELGTGQLMLAGAGAGAVYWLTVYPADVIKSKLQVDSYQRLIYKGTLDCTRQVCLLHLLLFTAEMHYTG